jgi:hypothetical protein
LAVGQGGDEAGALPLNHGASRRIFFPFGVSDSVSKNMRSFLDSRLHPGPFQLMMRGSKFKSYG